MARIRSVHPGLFTDEAFVSCSPFARLLAIGIWTECDDKGAFEWKPVTLKMKLLPADNVDVAALLEELASQKLICRYEVGGRQFGAVRNFCRFQTPRKPQSRHPMPDELRTYVALNEASTEPGGDDDDPVSPKSEKSRQMEDGDRNRRNISSIHSSPTPSPVSLVLPAFPPDGSVNYTPWADFIRSASKTGADVDDLAQAFRKFCRSSNIDLASPHIAKAAQTFFGKHRIRRVA